MQIIDHTTTRPIPAPMLFAEDPASSPAAMASYLRRTSGDAAFCFARAMHEDSAWANPEWGAYWADVMRLV